MAQLRTDRLLGDVGVGDGAHRRLAPLKRDGARAAREAKRAHSDWTAASRRADESSRQRAGDELESGGRALQDDAVDGRVDSLVATLRCLRVAAERRI